MPAHFKPMNKTSTIAFFLITIFFVSLFGCSEQSQRKKIFYINSYHQGYAASDSVMEGIKETLPQTIDVTTFYLDAKRLLEDNIAKKAREAIGKIKEIKPNLIIASDDDAVKRVIVPHFKNTQTPVVFCGVNWTAANYKLPTVSCTGMLEVLPLHQTIRAAKKYNPQMRDLVVLSENSISEQKNKDVLDTLYRSEGLLPQYALVDNFDQWKQAFVEANKSADVIYIPTNGAIKNWNKEEAMAFVTQQIKKPVITCDDFMMSYAVIGFTKVAKEQGEWAAQTAMRILDGTDPQTIPLVKNKKVRGWLNETLANEIGYKPDTAIINRLTIINTDRKQKK